MAYIMVVDDDPDFTGAVETVLQSEGHEIKVVMETGAALNQMKERRPDLLILDVMFPENNSEGFDFARKLREEEALKDVPILMLTAVNERFPLGFNSQDIDHNWLPISAFMDKPVDFDVLKEKVAGLLKG